MPIIGDPQESPDVPHGEQELDEAIELVRIGSPYRSYPGTGGIWAGQNTGMCDARFDDWGLARATVMILNAVLDGTLVKARGD